MTLPLETVAVGDQYAKRALDVVAQQFPIAPPNALGAIPTTTATLPTGTFSGQDFYYALSGGGVWHFKYNLTSTKWDFAGGPPAFAEITANENTASVAYTALVSPGPSIALPFAGDYIVAQGAQMFNGTTGAQNLMSYDIGGTGAVDADAVAFQQPQGGGLNSIAAVTYERPKTGLTAVTLTSKYRVVAGTGNFLKRWMRVTPIRVG